MKYTVNVKGSASIKGKIFPGGKDFTQKELSCNKKEIDQLLKEGTIREAKEAEKVITELEKVTEELEKAKDALSIANDAIAAKNAELEQAKKDLEAAAESLKTANDELAKLKENK